MNLSIYLPTIKRTNAHAPPRAQLSISIFATKTQAYNIAPPIHEQVSSYPSAPAAVSPRAVPARRRTCPAAAAAAIVCRSPPTRDCCCYYSSPASLPSAAQPLSRRSVSDAVGIVVPGRLGAIGLTVCRRLGLRRGRGRIFDQLR